MFIEGFMKFIPYIIAAIAIHIAFWEMIPPNDVNISKIKNKKKYIVVRAIKKKSRAVIEAPQKPTSAPDDADFIGKTTHKTNRQTKVKSNITANKNAAREKLSSERKYSGLLPSKNDEEYFRDFIADENIGYGDAIDVNTYEYPLLGYFSLIRQQVAMSFTDPRSKLKNSPIVNRRLEKRGSIDYQGSTVAEFVIDRSGLMLNIKTVKSSGDKELDKVWRKILTLAAPFPPLPKHYQKPYLKLNYSLYYDFILSNGSQVRRFHY